MNGFSEVWIDLCWCPICVEHVWHIELADERERDGYVAHCPDCGHRLGIVAPEWQGQGRIVE